MTKEPTSYTKYKEITMKGLHIQLLTVSALHRKGSVEQFSKLNLTSGQPKVLATLAVQEGIMQKELAAICQVEPATMTSLLKKMEGGHLIHKVKETSSLGKRINRIYLTDFGRSQAIKVEEIVENLEDICFTGFTEAEQASLIHLLDRVALNLKGTN